MVWLDWRTMGADVALDSADGSQVVTFDSVLTRAVGEVVLTEQAEGLRLNSHEVMAAAGEWANGWWSVYRDKRALAAIVAAGRILSADW